MTWVVIFNIHIYSLELYPIVDFIIFIYIGSSLEITKLITIFFKGIEMNKMILCIIAITSLSLQANELIGLEKDSVFFEKSQVKLDTTATYTSYNYGEPVVRFYESLDKVELSRGQSRKLYPELKEFYKVKKNGKRLKATLDTNYFGFVDDIIEITCENEEKCSLGYNQELKEKYLLSGGYPEYEAGLIGTFVNNFNTSSIEEAKLNLKSFKERGLIDRVISFQQYDRNPVFKLAIGLGALAGLLKDANLCDEFVKHRCAIYCSGSPQRNRDLKNVGTCIMHLE